MQETWVRSLGERDAVEKETATHSSILAWEISWIEKPGGLQSIESQRIRHDLATKQQEPMMGNMKMQQQRLAVGLRNW